MSLTEPSSSELDPIIAFDRVSMGFGRHSVLRDINLKIPRGETIAVIGESGCGKTVLLKLIVGLIQPISGVIRFQGRSLNGLSERDLIDLRLRIGFLFQSGALFDSLSIFDNVAFGLRALKQLEEGVIQERVIRHLQEVGLPAQAATRMPSELSGGMRKRVGLARALALDPEVMLYDEPTTGLDPIMSDVINELILQVRRAKPITSVVVTHDMKTAQKVGSRIVMLYPLARLGQGESQILFDGTPAELLTCDDPRVRQFIEGQAGDRITFG